MDATEIGSSAENYSVLKVEQVMSQYEQDGRRYQDSKRNQDSRRYQDSGYQDTTRYQDSGRYQDSVEEDREEEE